MEEKYVAYLDLVGTKSAALISYEAYNDLIKSYKYTLKSMAEEFPKVKANYFSDSLFISCKDKSIFQYLRKLRVALLLKDCFFAGAIMRGDDGVEKVDESNLSGISFNNSDIVNVYALQSKFKGIGILVKDDIISDKNKGEFVKSLFIASDQGNPYYVEYWDISFKLSTGRGSVAGSSKIKSYIGYLKTALVCHVKMSTLNPRAVKYYFTLSVTIISSMFQYCEITSECADDIGKLFFERQSEKLLSDFEIVDIFAVFIDKYYQFLKEQKKNNDIFEYIGRFYESKLFSLLVGKLQKYPSIVLSDEVKKVIVDSIYEE